MKKNYRLVQLLFEILGFLCVLASMFIIMRTPVTGNYEVSLYSAYPSVFWVLLSLALFSGLLSGFLSISDETSYRWAFGFFIVVVVNVIVLLQPYFRNYAFTTQWDDINHFSEARNIYDYGQPYLENFYPASHVLLSAFSLLSGINLQTCTIIFPTIFYIIYLSNMGGIAWLIDERPGSRGLIMLSSAPILYNVFSSVFRPTHFAVMMFPLVLEWAFRSKFKDSGWQETTPFLLIILYLPFLHPWGAIATLVFLICMIGASILPRLVKHQNPHILYSFTHNKVGTSIVILFVSWWTWFSSHRIFGSSFQRIVNSFNEALGGAHSLSDYLARAEKASLSISQIFSLLVFTYGPMLLYIFLGIVSIWIIYAKIKRNRYPKKFEVSISLFTLVFLFIALVSMFRDLITEGPFRITNFVLAVLPLLFVGAFYNNPKNSPETVFDRHHFITKPLLISLVICAAILGVFNTYYSPITGQPNHQFSYSEQAGVQFLVDYAENDNASITSPFGGAFILSSVNRSSDLAKLREQFPRWWIQVAPDHFDYSSYPETGFGRPGYLIIAAPEKAYYTVVWPEGGRINTRDFQALSQNSLWSRVYDAGDITIFRSNVH